MGLLDGEDERMQEIKDYLKWCKQARESIANGKASSGKIIKIEGHNPKLAFENEFIQLIDITEDSHNAKLNLINCIV